MLERQELVREQQLERTDQLPRLAPEPEQALQGPERGLVPVQQEQTDRLPQQELALGPERLALAPEQRVFPERTSHRPGQPWASRR